MQSLAAGTSELVCGRLWRARAHRRHARELVAAGRRTTLFLFSRTAVYHRVRFHQDGYWEHRGGLFGRSERTQPLFRVTTFGNRVREELHRIALQRGLAEQV